MAATIAIGMTLPAGDTVPSQDDWDYMAEMASMPLLDYALKPNPAGQFNPLFKLVYAAFANGSAASNVPFQFFNLALRLGTVVVFIRLLQKMGSWSVGGALALLAACVCYVGMIEIYFWPLIGGLDVGVFLFALALALLTGGRPPSWSRAALAFATLVAGGLSAGVNVVAPFSLFAALVLARRARLSGAKPQAAALVAAGAVLALCFLLVDRPSEDPAPFALTHLPAVLSYFFYGTVVNGTLSALAPPLLPGAVHVLFFGVLALGTLWLALFDDSVDRRFVALSLLLTQVLIGGLVAATRYHHGVVHSSSYRYVYINMVLQLPLAALLLGVAAARRRQFGRLPAGARFAPGAASALAGVSLFALSVYGGARGYEVWREQEALRCECLEGVARGNGDAPCLASLYYRSDPEFVRRVYTDDPVMRSRWRGCGTR